MGNRIRSALAAALLRLGTRRAPAEPRRLRRQLWSHSTQRMGVRFTERLRDAFRRRWLRVVPRDGQGEIDE